MSSVDQRVVELKFNAGAFGKGIADTLAALTKLQDGLKLSGASQGAQQATAGIQDLGNQTGLLGGKFSAMQAVALGALASIGSKAVATGSQIISALTIDPIKTGLQEYETNLNSIQTILANTQVSGAGLPEVNAALDELNHYSDQTIYNFSEMARNIGTFTAAGVNLETATGSIKGIANLAALSGSNSQQASGAMYQLSQAISAGRVSLMDWNSVVNAGMGGTVFQRALAQTAVQMGTLSESTVTLEGDMQNVSIAGKSFRDSIDATNGPSWLTSDVLTATLNQFTGDLTDAELAAQGFTQEQIASIQQTAMTAQKAATEVKTLSGVFDTAKEVAGSGWSTTWRYIFGDFMEAKTTFTELSGWVNGFIERSADARNNLLAGWKELGGREVMLEGFRNAGQALTLVFAQLKRAWATVFPPQTAQGLFSLTEGFRNLTQALIPNQENLANIMKTFRGLFSILGIVWELVKAGVGFLGDLLGAFSGTGDGILGVTANIGDFLYNLHQAIKSGDFFGKMFDTIAAAAQPVVRAIQAVVQWIGSLFDGVKGLDASGFSKVFEPMEEAGGRIAVIFNKVVDVFKTAGSAIGDFFSMVGDSLSGITSVFTSAFDFDADTILGGLGIGLGAGILLLFNRIKNAIQNFDIFGGMGGGFFQNAADALESVNGVLGAMQTNLKASALLKIAGAIAILAASVFVLAGIDSEGLIRATSALTVMFVQLGAAMAVFSQIGTVKDAAKLTIMSVGLIALATAVLILTAAVKNLSELGWEELAKGLTGLTVMLAALAGAVKLMDGTDSKMVRTGAGLILLAAAIKILVSAVGDLVEYNWEQLARGLVSVGVLLGALALFTKFAEADSGGLKQGVGLILLATALKILASAVGDFVQYNWEELSRGMAGIGVGLALITAALNLIPNNVVLKAASIAVISAGLMLLADAVGAFTQYNWEELARGMSAIAVGLGAITLALMMIPTGSIFSAAAILVTAVSLNILADAMQQLSQLSWAELVEALVGIAAALGIIAIGLNLMVGTLSGSAALLVAAAALAVLAPVLQALGAMSIGDLVQALIGLAAVFTVLGIAGMLLAPVAVVLLAVGAAIFLLGAGVTLAAAGVLLFSVAITALAAAGAAGIAAVGALISLFIAMLPSIFTALGEAIVAFARVIEEGAPAIIAAFVALLTALLNAIIEMTPLIAQTLLTLLLTLFEVIRAALPQMIQLGFDILMAFLNGIAANIGNVVTAATNIIVNLLNGIASNMGRIVQAGVNLIVSFLQGLGSAIPQVVQAGLQMIVDVANGIANAISSVIPQLIDAAGNIASAIIDGIVDGIGNLASQAWDAVTDMASGLLDSALDFLGINSPSKEFMYIGQFVSQGMAVGIDNHAYRANRAVENMGSDLIRTMGKTIDGLGDMISGMNDLTPVITPVLDLSEIRRGTGQIGDILNAEPLDVSNIRASANGAEDGYLANLDALAEALSESAGTTNNFTQNNYSPKALSTADIYRRTNNQISKVKGGLAVNAGQGRVS